MIWLILGIALWWAAHLFKRAAPGPRAAMGTAGKGAVAVALVVSIVLMVIGFKAAEPTYLWGFSWAMHATDGLMLIAVGLLGLGHSKSRLRAKLRHPMLWAVVVWSVAHLLANGNLPALVLFGSLGVWALVEMSVINRAQPAYTPYAGGSVAGDVRLVVITLVAYAVIVLIHGWLGPWPVPMG